MDKWRGNEIYEKDGVFYYTDNNERVPDDDNRPCGECGKGRTPEGYDGCIGKIEGAVNACCGHGNPPEAYIQYPDNIRVSGFEALRIMKLSGN